MVVGCVYKQKRGGGGCQGIYTIYVSWFSAFDISSSSSCARSVEDIGDHGLPTLSVISSPDELVVWRFFSCYEIIHTVCVFCALSSTNLSTQYLFF